MKVAVIQLDAQNEKKKNLLKAADFCRQALERGARFVALPEVFNFRGKSESLAEVAENIPGPSLFPLMDLARQYKAYILAGSVYERIARQKKFYNTSVLINPKGEMSAIYRKRHMFDAVVARQKIRESKIFLPGKSFAMAAIEKFTIGLSICVDLRFPQDYQHYRKSGCQLLAVPSSFIQSTGEAHWEVLLRARAIENLSYVIAPNQTGKDANGVTAFGNSMIISPWGEVLARADTREEIIYAQVSLAEVQKVRRWLPGIEMN
jgi:deaminated glutathione amidase